jgi:hypothetical protein
MLPSINNQQSSSVNVTSYQSRHEGQTYTRLDRNPVSTHDLSETQTVEQPEKPDRASMFDVDDLVDQIWGFASARIAKAESNGASEEELGSLWRAAEKGVTEGFGEAKDILESLGELDDPLKLKIDSAFGQIMDKLGERSTDVLPVSQPVQEERVQTRSQPEAAGRNRAISLYQYERQTFSLNLTTAQGDEILIRSVAEQESNADDLKFGRLSSTSWSHSETSGFSLVIKGDLNEQESNDLDALLAQVNELAEEFYEGDFETAFNMAKDLNIDGTTLQSMDLNLKEIEHKGASVYAQTAGESTSLPRGLEPLKAYAEKLMAAQNNWADTFNSPKDFLNVLENHPTNKGSMGYAVKMLMA